MLFEVSQELDDSLPVLGVACLGEDCQHFLESVEADELMFAMELVDADEAAESCVVALLVETEHDDLLAFVGLPLPAVVFVLFEVHPS